MLNEDIVYFLFLSILLSCLLHVYLLDIHTHITHGDGFFIVFWVFMYL